MRRALGIAALLVLIAVVVGANGAPPSPPGAPPVTFEAASLKRQTDPAGPMRLGVGAPGRFTASNVTLLDMISAAYGDWIPFDRARIVGGPEWRDRDRFEVVARLRSDAPNPGALLTSLIALRALLAERFNLRVHVDSREMPVFALVTTDRPRAARALRRSARTRAQCEAAEDNPFSVDDAGTCPRLRNRPDPTDTDPLRMHLEARTIGMPTFAENLSTIGVASRPVIDRTGLAGEFDYELTWSRADIPSIADDRTVAANTGASLFTALREQLGLALQPQRGQVEVLVIDHVEPPAPN